MQTNKKKIQTQKSGEETNDLITSNALTDYYGINATTINIDPVGPDNDEFDQMPDLSHLLTSSDSLNSNTVSTFAANDILNISHSFPTLANDSHFDSHSQSQQNGMNQNDIVTNSSANMTQIEPTSPAITTNVISLPTQQMLPQATTSEFFPFHSNSSVWKFSLKFIDTFLRC